MTNKEDKFQIELELIDIKKTDKSKKIIRMTERNLKRMLMNRLEGKTGEC